MGMPMPPSMAGGPDGGPGAGPGGAGAGAPPGPDPAALMSLMALARHGKRRARGGGKARRKKSKGRKGRK